MIFLLEKKKKSRRRSSSGRRLPSPQASTTFSPSLVSTILFFFFFSSSRQVRRGVCLVAALSTTVAKATPLPRWAFRARFHPFVARIPLVHTRLYVRARARVYQRWNNTHNKEQGENAERILERRSSSRIDDFFILALILEVFSRGIICLTKFLRNNFGSFDLGIQENFMRLCES